MRARRTEKNFIETHDTLPTLSFAKDGAPDLLVFGGFALVGFLHGGACFVDGALGVVVGLDCEAVFVDGAVALAGDVEDAA